MAVNWKGRQLLGKVERAAFRGIVRGVEDVHSEATSLILETEKTGRIYTRRGVTHQASAPGEAPASDTGRLVQSGKTEYDRSDISGRVNWSTAYAAALEHGTEKMAPRSFARPALANKKDEIEQDIAAEIRKALK